MSATYESALTSHDSNEQPGFDFQSDQVAIAQPQNREEFRSKRTTGKAAKASNKQVSDITLVKLATFGFFEAAWKLFLYLNLWYVLYPVLLFASFYMSQGVLKAQFASLTPLRLIYTIAAVGAGMYYAYYLLVTFICEHSDPAMYANERTNFLLRICMYATIMLALMQAANLLNVKTIGNPENQQLFISFYLLYVGMTAGMKYFNYRVSR